MVVKFREVGNSMTVTIPKDIVLRLGIVQGSEANIGLDNNAIIVKPLIKNKKVTIKSLFANYNGNYKPIEIDWGEKKGLEVW